MLYNFVYETKLECLNMHFIFNQMSYCDIAHIRGKVMIFEFENIFDIIYIQSSLTNFEHINNQI